MLQQLLLDLRCDGMTAQQIAVVTGRRLAEVVHGLEKAAAPLGTGIETQAAMRYVRLLAQERMLPLVQLVGASRGAAGASRPRDAGGTNGVHGHRTQRRS